MNKSLAVVVIFLAIFKIGFSQRETFPPNMLVNTTIRIEGFLDSTVNGAKKWHTSIGTGFFYAFMIDSQAFYCIVTNKHVIEKSTFGRLRFKHETISGSTKLVKSSTIEIPKFNKEWIVLPDEDLAILPLKPIDSRFKKEFNSGINIVCFSKENIPSVKDSLEISSIEKVLLI